MRYLFLALSALWLAARAGAHAIRPRRLTRVRRYAAHPRPAGPVPIIWPSSATSTVSAPLPVRPSLPRETPERPVPVDVLACRRDQLRRVEEERPLTARARAARQQGGVIRLIAIAHQASAADERVSVVA